MGACIIARGVGVQQDGRAGGVCAGSWEAPELRDSSRQVLGRDQLAAGKQVSRGSGRDEWVE